MSSRAPLSLSSMGHTFTPRPPLLFLLLTFLSVLLFPFNEIILQEFLSLPPTLQTATNLFFLTLAILIALDYAAIKHVWTPATKRKALEFGWACWGIQGGAAMMCGARLLTIWAEKEGEREDMDIKMSNWCWVPIVIGNALGSIVFIRWDAYELARSSRVELPKEQEQLLLHGEAAV